MKLQLELTPEQAQRLQSEAARLGVCPEDLAKAVVADLFSGPNEDFQDALEATLAKNQELYRRLS